ncbi:MAG: DUF3052 family protein [bacterium]|nr:DUF3052 family protein [bacterium]
MAGYSGKPLAQKLGIKENFTMYIQNSPANYEQLIRPLPEGVVISKRLSNELDMIHFFVKSRKELSSDIENFSRTIEQNGMIWVFWPKKSSHVPTDVTENVIREVVLPLGLVDVKVCAVDEVWSGLKIVIRKENRR